MTGELSGWRGFTLVELLVVMAGVAVLAQSFYMWKRAAVADATVERAIKAFVTVDEAVYGFRIDNPGIWPADIDPGLASYLGAAAATELAARGFRLQDVPPNSFRIIGDMPTEGEAAAVARAFPGTGAVGTAVNTRGLWPVTVTITVPGQESSRDALLPRDGSRPMFGNLDADGNDIDMGGGAIDMGGGNIELNGGDVVGVGTAQADVLVFTAAVTAGSACPAGGVGRDSTGVLMTCQGGVWVSAQACNLLPPAPGGVPTPGYTRAERAGADHWLILVTTCGELPGIQFAGSNA